MTPEQREAVLALFENAQDNDDDVMADIAAAALDGDARALSAALDFWKTFREDNEL